MNLLILHPNYPAQFKHLCQWLPQHGIQITFIAQNLSQPPLPHVKVLCLAGKCSKDYLEATYKAELDRMLARGKQYLAAMQRLNERGYRPDVVIAHTGWGCAQHLKQLWPECKLVAYLEWIFVEGSDLSRYESPGCEQVIQSGMQAKLQARNQLTLSECRQADLVVTPTHWQRCQIPQELRHKCIVNHEGVDLDFYFPKRPYERDRQLITYGTRGMEPIRGFSYFVRELIRFLPSYPEVQVEIAGEDACFYSPSVAPDGSPSWGSWAKSQLKAAGVAERVHFLNRLPRDLYRDWLRHSKLHVYLTQPYVLSWSLLEALACAENIVLSNVPPVSEIVSDSSVLVVDHRSQGWLKGSWLKRSKPSFFQSLRSTSLRHSSGQSINRWHSVLRQLSSI